LSADPAELLAGGIDRLGLEIPAEARAHLLRHLELVREGNRSTNLTRISDLGAMVRDHVLDALALLPALARAGLSPPAGAQLLDVGTGAGFPGIPLALARPDLRVSLAESRGPKVRFLHEAVDALGLGGRISVLPHRAREIHHHRPELAGTFHLTTARAVADLARILREVKALVAPGGLVVHFKGPGLSDEERAAGTRDAQRYGFEAISDLEAGLEGKMLRFVIHRRGARGR
jgi:16S rRNA (guanine527-N7)-methyltransferase